MTVSKKMIPLLLVLSLHLKAQDIPTITLQQADSLFIINNLLLLSEKAQVEEAKAFIIQERLWDNPTISTEWYLYNQQKKEVLDIGRTGQKIIAVEQLFLLAGKRNKRVQWATLNAQLTELEFYNVLRTLKYELRTSFYGLYYAKKTIQIYEDQITRLDHLIEVYDKQQAKGNVSLKEVVRLKALRFQLNNRLVEVKNLVYEHQKNLKILLGTSVDYQPALRERELQRFSIQSLEEHTLIEMAWEHRPDVKYAENLLQQEEVYLSLQKANAVPDIRIGGIYDQAGSISPRYTGLTLAMDLPLWNRNQGNIKMAGHRIESQRFMLKERQLEVQNQINAALEKLQEIESLLQTMEKNFSQQFERLIEGVHENFRKQNITLVEFVDLIETYHESVNELNRLKYERANAYEELNFYVGTELF